MKPGREEKLEMLRTWVRHSVERPHHLAELKHRQRFVVGSHHGAGR